MPSVEKEALQRKRTSSRRAALLAQSQWAAAANEFRQCVEAAPAFAEGYNLLGCWRVPARQSTLNPLRAVLLVAH